MTKPNEPGRDYRPEEKADQLVRDILDRGLHQRAEVLALDAVPLFVWQDEHLRAGSRSVLASSWEKGLKTDVEDRQLIRQLRRTDLPPGSFFVLVWPGGYRPYHWRLHTP